MLNESFLMSRDSIFEIQTHSRDQQKQPISVNHVIQFKVKWLEGTDLFLEFSLICQLSKMGHPYLHRLLWQLYLDHQQPSHRPLWACSRRGLMQSLFMCLCTQTVSAGLSLVEGKPN